VDPATLILFCTDQQFSFISGMQMAFIKTDFLYLPVYYNNYLRHLQEDFAKKEERWKFFSENTFQSYMIKFFEGVRGKLF